MIDVRIDFDAIPAARELEALSDALRDRILGRVLNRVVRSVAVAASKSIREELTLPARDVRRALTVRGTRGRLLEARITISGRAVGLVRYRARQVRRGVSVQVKRRGGRKVVRGAFIARMRSGHEGVFRRQVEGGKRVPRLPIKELFSTSPAEVIGDRGIEASLSRLAQQRFAKELTHEIAFRMRGKGKTT